MPGDDGEETLKEKAEEALEDAAVDAVKRYARPRIRSVRIPIPRAGPSSACPPAACAPQGCAPPGPCAPYR